MSARSKLLFIVNLFLIQLILCGTTIVFRITSFTNQEFNDGFLP